MTNTENTQAPSANRQIARAAGTVMIAMVVSQLVGLLAKTLTARAFGTGLESDAFFAANRFSEIIFNLVAGGALGSAFIPTFTGMLAREERKDAWRLASSIANLVVLIMTVVALLSAVFAPQIVRSILAPGFDAETAALTVTLLRIQLPSAVIFGLSGLLMGILNAHQSFLLPALAPALYQIGWVFGALVLSPRFGVQGMSWSIVIGASLHLLVQVPALFRLPQRRYHPSLGFHIPAVLEVGRLMAPRLLGVAVVQLNFLLNTYLASLQPQGSYTGISLAFPIMIMPEAAIAQSIAIAALPTFSAQVARGRKDQMRTSLAASLRGALLLAIPASVGLILLRQPVVALLYQRGEFGPESTAIVAWALLWYAAGLVGHSVVEIISRAFYALHDTKTPGYRRHPHHGTQSGLQSALHPSVCDDRLDAARRPGPGQFPGHLPGDDLFAGADAPPFGRYRWKDHLVGRAPGWHRRGRDGRGDLGLDGSVSGLVCAGGRWRRAGAWRGGLCPVAARPAHGGSWMICGGW